MNDERKFDLYAEFDGSSARVPRSVRVSGYFFDELKAYIGFDPEVEELLRESAVVVEPHFEEVGESFYDALNANARTRNIFSGPAQIERLKNSLQDWLRTGMHGPWNSEFFEHRSHVGEVHVKVGLLPHFMGGAMNIVRRHICSVLYDNFDEGMTIAHLEAVSSWLDLELTIMLQAYWDYMMKLKLEMPLALATGLAHEIRNPLNAIGLNLTLLERKLDSTDETAPILDAVRSEIMRINTLTTEIMDFAKPVDIHPRWHRADQMLKQLEATHGATFDASHIEFTTSLEGGDDVWCDMDRMRQALFNLLTNAVQAIDGPGKVAVNIIIKEFGTTIEVVDTGVGMEPATVYQIFDLFYTRKAAGTGLGLPIVKSIIEAHGGTIEVASKPGKGTTFSIRLPRPAR